MFSAATAQAIMTYEPAVFILVAIAVGAQIARQISDTHRTYKLLAGRDTL